MTSPLNDPDWFQLEPSVLRIACNQLRDHVQHPPPSLSASLPSYTLSSKPPAAVNASVCVCWDYREEVGSRQSTSGRGLTSVQVWVIDHDSHCQRRDFFLGYHDEKAHRGISLPVNEIHSLTIVFLQRRICLSTLLPRFKLSAATTVISTAGKGLCDEVPVQKCFSCIRTRQSSVSAQFVAFPQPSSASSVRQNTEQRNIATIWSERLVGRWADGHLFFNLLLIVVMLNVLNFNKIWHVSSLVPDKRLCFKLVWPLCH